MGRILDDSYYESISFPQIILDVCACVCCKIIILGHLKKGDNLQKLLRRNLFWNKSYNRFMINPCTWSMRREGLFRAATIHREKNVEDTITIQARRFSQWKPEARGAMPWPLGKQHLMSLRWCDQLRSYTSHLVEIIWVAWRPLEKHWLRVMKSWGRIRIMATLEEPSPRVATLESSAPRIAMLEISSSRNVRIIKSCLNFFLKP